MNAISGCVLRVHLIQPGREWTASGRAKARRREGASSAGTQGLPSLLNTSSSPFQPMPRMVSPRCTSVTDKQGLRAIAFAEAEKYWEEIYVDGGNRPREGSEFPDGPWLERGRAGTRLRSCFQLQNRVLFSKVFLPCVT